MSLRSLLTIKRFRAATALVVACVLASEPVLAALAEPGRGPTVPAIRIIQDIHAHPEAQRSIADALGRLQKESGRALRVGVEGASGPFDFAPYYAFPDDRLRRTVASQMLDESRIAGPIYAALSRPAYRLVGIEDPALYRGNVRAYLSARSQQARLLKTISERKAALARKKSAAFSGPLARFDARVSAYRAGDLAFGDYLEAVSVAAGDTGFAVEQFLVAHRMERSLNFSRVEAERKTFVERLVRSLSASDVGHVRRWIDGLGEDSGAGRRFEFLFHAARARGVDMGAFPALVDYVRYLRLSEGVDPDRLFVEAAAAEEMAFRRLVGASGPAASLISEARRLHLTEKLLRFEMTHEDWRGFRRIRPAGTELPETDLRPFEDFYRIAAERDAALAARARKGKLDAIVVGGFHTEGLTAAFRAAGIPYEIVRPRITSALPGDATAYLSVFAAERTPLERLFSRFRLFLAPPAVIGVPAPLVASRNDDAPSRFAAKYRLVAGARPELAPAVEKAADRLDATLRGVADRSERLNRPNSRWLTETSFLLVLAAGLVTGTDWLSAAGIAVQLFGLPLAHTFTVDRGAVSPARRFTSRVVWSAAFLGVYGGAVLVTAALGLPLWAGAALAVMPAAWAHRLNHVAVRFPGSITAAWLFDRLKLPVLRMSTGPEELSADERRIIDLYAGRMSAALLAWTAQPDRGVTEKDTDPVIDFIAAVEPELAANTDEHNANAITGITKALLEARMTPEQMRIRATRDFAASGNRSLDLPAGSPVYQMNARLVALLYRQVKIGYPEELGGAPMHQAIELARAAGIEIGFARMMREAIADWRARRGDDLLSGDERIGAVIDAGNEVGKVATTNFAVAVRGVKQGVLQSRLSPEELGARARRDTQRTGAVRQRPATNSIVGQVYAEVAGEVKRTPGAFEQLLGGVSLGLRDIAQREFSDVLTRWRASDPDPLKRDPGEILSYFNEVFSKDTSNTDRTATLMAGIANAWVAAGLSREDQINLAYAGSLFAFSHWIDSGADNDPVMDAILAIQARVADSSAVTEGLIKIGRDQGWLMSMEHAGTEAVRRFRKETGVKAPLAPQLALRVIPMAGRFDFRISAMGAAIARGIMDATLTDVEGAVMVGELLVPALEAAPFQDDRNYFSIAANIVNQMLDQSAGSLRDVIGLALDEYFNPSHALERLLGEWKDKVGDAGLNRRILNVWIRLPNLRKRSNTDDTGVGQSGLAQVMEEAELSPEQLMLRAHADVSTQFVRFLKRDLADEEVYWPDQIQDPASQAAIGAYIALARRYQAAGDTARVQAIFEGLALAANDPFEMGNMFQHSVYRHKYALPLRDIADAAMEMKQWDSALGCARLILSGLEPSYEMPEIVGWAYRILGDSYMGSGDPDSAMLNGQEYATAMAYQELAPRTVSASEWARFMPRAMATAFLFDRQGGHTAADSYYAWMARFLEKNPQVRAELPPVLMARLAAMRAAADIGLRARPRYDAAADRIDPASVARLQAQVEIFDEQGLIVMRDTTLSDGERHTFLNAAIGINSDACFLGDPSRVERVRSLAQMLYPSEPLLVLEAELHAKRNLAVARPADRARLFAEIDAVYAANPATSMSLSSVEELLFQESYGLYLAVKGDAVGAESVLRRVDAAVQTPEFRRGLGDTAGEAPADADERERRDSVTKTIGRMRVMTLTQLAGIMSGRSAPAQEIAAVLQTAFALEGYDPRVMPDLHRFLEPNFYRLDVLLDAVGVALSQPERAGAPLEGRLAMAEWARALSPEGVAARRAAWTENNRQRAIGKAVGARFALLETVAAGEWPGKLLLLLDHDRQMRLRNDQYERALAGINTKARENHEQFLSRWAVSRLMLQVYAGVLAGAGLPDQSLDAVRTARRLTQEGVKKFIPGAKFRAPEDLGVLLFPTIAGNHSVTIDEASRELRADDTSKMTVVGPPVLAAAEQVGEEAGFENARDLSKAIDAAVRLVEKLRSAVPPAAANYVLGRLYLWGGDFGRAVDAVAKAAAETSERSDVAAYRSRAASELASLTLRDPRYLLPARLNESQRLLDDAKTSLEHSRIYVGYLELVIALHRYNPAEPASAGALVRRAMELARLAAEQDDWTSALGYGLALRMADVAIAVGPASSAEIVDELTGIRPLIGPKMESVEVALQLLNRPEVFLAWSDVTHAGDTSVDWTAVRLAAAVDLGDTARAIVEAERLVDQRPPQFTEAYWMTNAADILMESPRLRAAFLKTILPLLAGFQAEAWVGKDRQDTLRRLIDVASRLGDPEIIYVLDALSENKAFPLRDYLSKTNVGLISRLEPSLHADEWFERIERMEQVNPGRMATLQRAAEARMTNDADRARLAALIEDKRTGFASRQAAGRLLFEARTDYRGLEIEAALDKLTRVEARFRNAEWNEVNDQVRRLKAVWDVYQRGEFEAATEVLGSFPAGDPVPTLLRNRIVLMIQARGELADHRPQSAEVTLNAINGNLPDRQKKDFEAQVIQADRDSNAAFERMKRAGNELPNNLGALAEVRRHLRATLAIDAEFKSVMRNLITRAQTMIDLGKISIAEELLTMLAEESRLFDTTAPIYGALGKDREQFERFRALARGVTMKDWLAIQLKVLKAEYEAREHLAARSRPADPSGAGVEQQVFHLGEWDITDGGLFVISSLNREIPGTVGPDSKTPLQEAVQLPTTEFFQSSANFQLVFPLTGDNRAMAGVTFLRRDRDNRLIFAADPSAVEVIRQMQRAGRKAATMRFVADISLAARINAMQETLSLLDRQISALREGRPMSGEFRVVNRLLGLDVSPQASGPVDGGPQINSRFAEDPSQLAAIQAVIHPLSEVTEIQGPPGTGKTSTAVEIARLLTSGTKARPGRVIVMTSQAHAGVDNIGIRLRDAGVTIVRSASGSAQAKVARELQTEEVETPSRKSRLDQLMGAIEAHAGSGTGFVYLATNNGLRGDKKTFTLLTMYLAGAPMSEIRARHAFFTRRPVRTQRPSEQDETPRKGGIRPVWGQEEAGQANASETLAIAWALRPDKAFLFGDQDQLAPHPIDESTQRLVEQEVRQGLKLSVGPVAKIFTNAANQATETSLFEMSYGYAAKWSHLDRPNGGGILLRFLSLARRSVWIITASIVNVFYGDRLRHRDEAKEEKEWEKVRRDTVVFVNSAGREIQSGESEVEPESAPTTGDAPIARGRSRVNFMEVGEVIRAATYHLNGRSPGADRRRREAGDILILTPYRGQNKIINETLRVLATLNDFAEGEAVDADELRQVGQVLERHANDARLTGRDQLRRAMSRLGAGDRRANVRELLNLLRPMYDLFFDGDIQITRADLPKLQVETPPAASAEVAEDEPQESLDELQANVIEAKTVHSVQGQERKVVIVSLVRSQSLGFLDDRRGQKTGRRIINVALSRVEDQLVVIYSNGLYPNSVGEMIPRLKANFARQAMTFAPISRFPARKAEMASLRRAWGVSLGEGVNRFVDTRVAPWVETGAFLVLLGVGLMQGDALVTVAGLLMKSVVFPLLHLLPGWLGLSPDAATPGQAAALFRLSAILTAIYVVSFYVLTAALVSPVPAVVLAMIPVVLRHLANNAEAARPLDTRPAAALELDTLSGVAAERPARLAAELVPPIRRARDPRMPDVRAANSGA